MKYKIRRKKQQLPIGHTLKGIEFNYSLQTFANRFKYLYSYAVKIKPDKYQLVTGEILTYKENEIIIVGPSGVPEFKDILYQYMHGREVEALLEYLNFYGKLLRKLRLGIFMKPNRFETKNDYHQLTTKYRRDNNYLFGDIPHKNLDLTGDDYIFIEEDDEEDEIL